MQLTPSTKVMSKVNSLNVMSLDYIVASLLEAMLGYPANFRADNHFKWLPSS